MSVRMVYNQRARGPLCWDLGLASNQQMVQYNEKEIQW